MSADLLARLHARSAVAASGCRLWFGSKNSHGYGNMAVGGRAGRVVGVHRLAWEIANQRTIPAGMQVCHRCDVRNCIEPDHLFLGTNGDNVADKVAKGRQAKAANAVSGLARLTPDQVRLIRGSGRSRIDLAAELGVRPQTISNVRTGRSWGHI